MKLATRVSLFFLGSLAVILAGFSSALYLLASRHLHDQLDRQVASALATLTAVVEIKDDGVEWEPHERRLDLPGVRWLVSDPQGRMVGTSPEPFPAELALATMETGQRTRIIDRDDRTWRVVLARISPSVPVRPTTQRENRQDGDNREVKFSSLVIVAAVPAWPVDATLRLLAWTLTGLSLAAWSASALVGRWLCWRTLAPVARMAESARSIRATEPGQRLDVAPTSDELEDLGRSFNGLLDRLQEAFERQRRFAGEASHQLRTPLAVMLGQVDVALRRDRPPEEYRRVLGVVAEQSNRLHRIVEMLLFLARADAEAASPALSNLALGPWLTAHLAGWSSHPRAANLRLMPCAEDLHALAHPPLLGQAVDILLDNACKFSEPDAMVTLSLRADARKIRITVEDAGCGIAPEDLPRVFEPFFQSPHQGRAGRGGVGLGLAIARRIVAAMGGAIEAESEPGRGSRFTVWLNCCPPEVAEENKDAPD